MKLQLFLELPLEKTIVRRSDSKRTLLKQDRTMEENLIFQVLWQYRLEMENPELR